MKIEILTKHYQQMGGLARYAASLCEALEQLDLPHEVSRLTPTFPLLIRMSDKALRRAGFDLSEFLRTFPIAAPFSRESVKHLTTQQMGSLLFFNPRLERTVITVHDIIKYLVRGDQELDSTRPAIERLFDRLSIIGLQRADLIISDSEFTKRTLIETLKIPAQKIEVVPLGMTHSLFRPINVSDSFRGRFGLPADTPYLLHIGTEIPRKNLPRLLQAFALLKRRMPNVKLIKIRTNEYPAGAQQLEKQIDELGLKDDVLFYQHLSEEELVAFYNLADLFVFPSLYEGFGLPTLEAMACGTPVVTSNQSSLPEVVGDAAILVDPYDVEAIADGMMRILSDKALAASLREKGLERAQSFSWERTARETVAVYERLHERQIQSERHLAIAKG